MTNKITTAVIREHLKCEYKTTLLLKNEIGEENKFIKYLRKIEDDYRSRAQNKLIKRIKDNAHHHEINVQKLSNSISNIYTKPFYKNDTCKISFESIIHDSKDDIWVPIIFTSKNNTAIYDKILLSIFCYFLQEINGLSASKGMVVFGEEFKIRTINTLKLMPRAEEIIEELYMIQKNILERDMYINKECDFCEFKKKCIKKAERDDSLCLIRGISKKEIKKLHKKGIFTVTQYSYTFRPRRNKTPSRKMKPFKANLKALSIREKKIHVYELPDIPTAKTQIFIDVEGTLNAYFHYLVGVVVVEGHSKKKYSFWADNFEEEIVVFRKLLNMLDSYKDYVIYHYGDYERKYFNKMLAKIEGDDQSRYKGKLEKSCNILSHIYSNIYFPTYTNSLKDIATYLDFSWTKEGASGIQCILWHDEWIKTHDISLRNKIIEYNYEDCLALFHVFNSIVKMCENSSHCSTDTCNLDVIYCDDIKSPYFFKFWSREYALPEIEKIHKFSIFDYQREKVFVRTDEAVRKTANRGRKNNKKNLRPNKKEIVTARVCTRCKSKDIKRKVPKVRKMVDLKFFSTGVKGWITQVESCQYVCNTCNNKFIPIRYRLLGSKDVPQLYRKHRSKYGHSLIAWTMFQHVENKLSFRQIQKNFSEIFNMHVEKSTLHGFKKYAHHYYEKTYESLVDQILGSDILYVDETPLKMKKEAGYAWVFTNNIEIISIYQPTREGEFLKDFLCNYKGILVADFYAAYDSINCTHQKCLIHLIRDMNDDLLKSPFDEELKNITRSFTILMQSIVKTIDRYGLKKRNLNKHNKDVERFYNTVISRQYSSESSQYYQNRFIKFKDKLFQFLNFDNVSWNNNNAERAIKLLSTHSNKNIKLFSSNRIDEYLRIMSIYQTCVYNNVSFLKFMVSKEKDFHLFLKKLK